MKHVVKLACLGLLGVSFVQCSQEIEEVVTDEDIVIGEIGNITDFEVITYSEPIDFRYAKETSFGYFTDEPVDLNNDGVTDFLVHSQLKHGDDIDNENYVYALSLRGTEVNFEFCEHEYQNANRFDEGDELTTEMSFNWLGDLLQKHNDSRFPISGEWLDYYGVAYIGFKDYRQTPAVHGWLKVETFNDQYGFVIHEAGFEKQVN